MDDNYNEDGFGCLDLPIARCTHCGKGIFRQDEAMIINANKSTVHMDCWVDYAEENYEEFLSEFYG